jgi:hypothetical protein
MVRRDRRRLLEMRTEYIVLKRLEERKDNLSILRSKIRGSSCSNHPSMKTWLIRCIKGKEIQTKIKHRIGEGMTTNRPDWDARWSKPPWRLPVCFTSPLANNGYISLPVRVRPGLIASTGQTKVGIIRVLVHTNVGMVRQWVARKDVASWYWPIPSSICDTVTKKTNGVLGIVAMEDIFVTFFPIGDRCVVGALV